MLLVIMPHCFEQAKRYASLFVYVSQDNLIGVRVNMGTIIVLYSLVYIGVYKGI